MAKINRVDANIFDIPAGANTTKTGAVYINNGNYRIEPTDGRKAFTSHVKICIGVTVNDRSVQTEMGGIPYRERTCIPLLRFNKHKQSGRRSLYRSTEFPDSSAPFLNCWHRMSLLPIFLGLAERITIFFNYKLLPIRYASSGYMLLFVMPGLPHPYPSIIPLSSKLI